MHPWYRSDKPGIAPDCGMKLVPVYASECIADCCASPPGSVADQSRRVSKLWESPAPRQSTVRLTGSSAPRARWTLTKPASRRVSTKVSGWVQKVFVDSTFQHVTKGEPLFTVYSPDLLAAEQEYLLALKARKTLSQSSLAEVSAGGASLLEAARMKLSLLDVTPDQIHDLEATGKPQREITIYSPASGPCARAQGISQSICHPGN